MLLRFHFTGKASGWWELDDVAIGRRVCDRVPGGVVLGATNSANTQEGVNGVRIASEGAPTVMAAPTATPNDPNLGDGFYWLFSPGTGPRRLTASRDPYVPATVTADVKLNGVTRTDFNLDAGQLTVSPDTIRKTVVWADTTRQALLVTNTGTAAATVHIRLAGVSAAPWLSLASTSITVPAHRSARISVTLRASDASITCPGVYQAQLIFNTNTPRPVPPVPVRMTVSPNEPVSSHSPHQEQPPGTDHNPPLWIRTAARGGTGPSVTSYADPK